MTIIDRADLACREGSKDAVYHLQIVQREGGYTVDYQNGRRGGTLTPGTKTKAPVTMEAARKIFDKVVREKMTASPPYTPIASAQGQAQASSVAMAHISSEMSERTTGMLPELLNAISRDEAEHYIRSDNWVAEQKVDGERRMLRAADGQVSGANRRGLLVPVEVPVVQAVAALGRNLVLDGELIGDRFFAFDLLELDGRDLRPRPFGERKAALDQLADGFGPAVSVVQDARTSAAKRELLARAEEMGQEGVVFKSLLASHSVGRPSSGGNQLKVKFVEDATVIVMRPKEDRSSVVIGVLDASGELVEVGSVKITGVLPKAGELIDVQYQYAYLGGSLFQPVYKRERPDLERSAAVMSQLKYKCDHVDVPVQDAEVVERPRQAA